MIKSYSQSDSETSQYLLSSEMLYMFTSHETAWNVYIYKIKYKDELIYQYLDVIKRIND